MIINPQDFVIDIPDLHPLSNDYVNFWREQYRKCVEGTWLGGYYMPPGLYFYVNFGTILLNKKHSNTKSIGRPWLRDLEWMFFQHWMEARGFSGFVNDNEYSGNFLLLDENITDEYLRNYYPSTFNSDNIRKEFRHPRTLLEEQHPYHKGAPLYENEAHNLLMLGSRDTGKGLPKHTLIPTPHGFQKIEDLRVGNRVFGIDGKATTVTGVFPQGIKKTCKITLSDKREFITDEDHLNLVSDGRKQKVITSKELLNSNWRYKHKKSGYSYRYKFPVIQAVEYSKKENKIPPYVLGVLLGDGDMKHASPRLATTDLFILNKVLELLPFLQARPDRTTCNYILSMKDRTQFIWGSTNRRENVLSKEIKRLGLNVNCEEKFIPDSYLFSSVEDRLHLLQGLLDTDGSITQSGSIEFTNKNKILCEQVIELCRSLGIQAQLGIEDRRGKIRKFEKKKEAIISSIYYRVYINTHLECFSLPSKKERLKVKSASAPSIVNLEWLGEEETICISVDNSTKTYLATRDYIPTHNTYMVGLGVVLHQWLFNGLTSLSEDISDRGVADITVGAELAHYSTNMLTKTKFAFEHLLGTKTVNGRRYPSPFYQNYKGSWNAGSIITAESKIKKPGGWETTGTYATIRHRTFRDNPFAEQGTRPITIVIEEAGHCSNLMDIYSNTKDNLRNGLRKTGTLLMLGTGGDMDSGTLDAHEMFYEPEAYDILAFEDTWEQKGNIGFFVPAYLALNEYKDERGFSKIEEAKKALNKAREKAKTGSGGSEALNKEIQYRPIVPSEIFLTKHSQIFPTAELRRRLSELQTNNTYELLEKKVQLFFDPDSPYNGVNYHIDENLIPITRFPWTSEAIEGATIMYEAPVLIDHKVPKGAYIIGCDPFRDNTGLGSSFAAIYVIKTSKYPSTVGHNEIVASYIGRPYQGVNAVNEILYKLSLFYGNASIYFENAVGNVKDYFEKIHRLDLLATQPVNVFNRKASYNTNEPLIYGYPMSNDKIKWEALQYLRSWLLEPRENNKRNIDLIPDKFLLQQLIMFNLDGNFDAVMGFVGCIIGLEEIYVSAKRSAINAATMSALDVEIDKLFVSNKRLFYNNDKELSKTTTSILGKD